MDLRAAAAGQVFFLTKADHFAAKTRKCFLNDAIPRFDQTADVANATDQGTFERFRRNAGRMAGELAALMLLPRADVVVARTGTAVGRCPDHVRPALAPKQPGEKVNPPLRLLEVHPPIDRLADLEL